MSAEDDLIDAVYLGDDWMLYASTDISYEWSEAVAPCLILSCDTGELCLSWGGRKSEQQRASFSARCWGLQRDPRPSRCRDPVLRSLEPDRLIHAAVGGGVS